jgi:hypothetical protein
VGFDIDAAPSSPLSLYKTHAPLQATSLPPNKIPPKPFALRSQGKHPPSSSIRLTRVALSGSLRTPIDAGNAGSCSTCWPPASSIWLFTQASRIPTRHCSGIRLTLMSKYVRLWRQRSALLATCCRICVPLTLYCPVPQPRKGGRRFRTSSWSFHFSLRVNCL